MAQGWVYIITNQALAGLVKVGFTTNHPHERARELRNTGVPHPYAVEYAVLVDNPRRLEKKVHRHLSGEKLKADKEWFRCSVEHATGILQGYSGQIYQEVTTERTKNNPAIDTKRQKVQDRLRQPEREQQQREEIDACLKVLEEQEARERQKLEETCPEIFRYRLNELSWLKLYISTCTILITASLLAIEGPSLIAPIVFVIFLIIGPVVTNMAYDPIARKLLKKQQSSEEYRQIQEDKHRVLAPLSRLFPPRPEPALSYAYQKQHNHIEPFFLTPFPQTRKQHLSGKASWQEGVFRGVVTNGTENWMVVLVALSIKIDEDDPVSVRLPLCVLPGGTSSFTHTQPLLKIKKPEKLTWSIGDAYGYEIVNQKEPGM